MWLSRAFGRALCALVIFTLAASSSFANTQTVAPMPVGLTTAAPAGFMGFCMRYLSECSVQFQGPVVVELSDARRQQLDAVQAKINATIQPQEDPSHVWDYPTNGTGDCNKYALAKQRELIALGWPREALLLTAALTERHEGHLVLVVRTTGGDLVLDNRVDHVIEWHKLPYQWVSRQSQMRPTDWVSISHA